MHEFQSDPQRAAQYVRMSTERQDYSIGFQTATNTAYALEHGYEIVRTYSDEGISGLRIERREGLKKLLADVISGESGFSTILVYDVSRWGRFQNPDQAAHYEFLCNEAGVKIEYCAEPFANDGTLTATLLKSMKRAMAAEYSRELSARIRLAKREAFARGFWPCGIAGYGLRRQIVDRSGRVLGVRKFGEHKAIQGAKSRLILGPPEETATIRRIYRLYVHDHYSQADIVRRLNDEAIPSDTGQPWTDGMVKSILTGEKYSGRLVFGRSRSFLGGAQPPTKVLPSEWQVIEHAIPPIVSRGMWQAAQRERAIRRQGPDRELLLTDLRRLEMAYGRVTGKAISRHGRFHRQRYVVEFGSVMGAIQAAGCHLNAIQIRCFERRTPASPVAIKAVGDAFNEQIVAGLRALLVAKGRLSRRLIDKAQSVPMAKTCASRLGGLMRAYALAGYVPKTKHALANRQNGEPGITIEEARSIAADANVAASDGFVFPPVEEAMLDALKALLKAEGRLSGRLINRAEGMPSSSTYGKVFGGMARVYELVGYETPSWRQRGSLEFRQRQATARAHPNSAAAGPSAAQQSIEEDMLAALRDLCEAKGCLSQKLINSAPNLPHRDTYFVRFGGLRRAYELVGYRAKWQRLLTKRTRAKGDTLPTEEELGRLVVMGLKQLLAEKGELSRSIIDRAPYLPSAGTIKRRWGSLRRLYAAAGYEPAAGSQAALLSD
jgi:DNA invertase Pin-like site-specific DNA recombinase